MEITAVVDRVGRIGAVRADDAAGRVECERRWWSCGGCGPGWMRRRPISPVGWRRMVSFPEQSIAETSKGSLGQASTVMERAATLESTPAIAAALDRGAVTAGHVDAITRAGKTLDPAQRENCWIVSMRWWTSPSMRRRRSSRGGCVTKPAACKPPTAWTRWNVNGERPACARGWISRACGTSRPASIRSPVSDSTPACVSHSKRCSRRRPPTPARPTRRETGSPAGVGARRSDPHRRQRRQAGTTRVRGGRRRRRSADPTGPRTEFSIPVEVPWRVLAELAGDADVHTVVVRNGVVLHAPGNLNLGRSTRLANRAQRRALRGLYATCAIPGCAVRYDHCKLHHVIWWRHGGRTDLDNLLPVCSGTTTRSTTPAGTSPSAPTGNSPSDYPDGTVQTTGPPTIRAA